MFDFCPVTCRQVARFVPPRRNALWQADFTDVRVGPEKLYVLVVLDDFSRFVVGHALADAPESSVATETLRKAIARHGKPEAIRTDRGGAFVAFAKETDFGRYPLTSFLSWVARGPSFPRNCLIPRKSPVLHVLDT